MVLTTDPTRDPFASSDPSESAFDPFSSATHVAKELDSNDPFAAQPGFEDPFKPQVPHTGCGFDSGNPFFDDEPFDPVVSDQAPAASPFPECESERKSPQEEMLANEQLRSTPVVDVGTEQRPEIFGGESIAVDPQIVEEPISVIGSITSMTTHELESTTEISNTNDRSRSACGSDSGNATCSTTETPQTHYDVLEDSLPGLRVPQLMLTEASTMGETTACNDTPSDGHTGLLDSSEAISESCDAQENPGNMIPVIPDGSGDASYLNFNLREVDSSSKADGESELGAPEDVIFTECPRDHSAEDEKAESEVTEESFEKIRLSIGEDQNRALTSSPIPETCSVRENVDEESFRDFMAEWGARSRETISFKDEQEKIDIEALRAAARTERETFYEERTAELRKVHEANMSTQIANVPTGNDQSPWKSIRSMVLEFKRNQIQVEGKCDISRMDNFLSMIRKKLDREERAVCTN